MRKLGKVVEPFQSQTLLSKKVFLPLIERISEIKYERWGGSKRMRERERERKRERD